MTPRLSLGLRLATLHASLSLVSGIQTPLWPLFLTWKGLDPVHLGLVLAAASIVKLVSGPLAGIASDLLGDRRLPMVALSIAALAFFVPFSIAGGFWPLLTLTLLAYGGLTALTPLADSLTLIAIAPAKIHYGHVRVWGSVSYVMASGLASYLLIGAPPHLILWAVLAAVAFIVFACWRTPAVKGERLSGKRQPMGALLTNPAFLLFLGAASFNMTSNTALYGFSTLHWTANGMSGGTIGLLWMEMVSAEAIFFVFGHRIAAAIGPRWLLAMGGTGGILRWLVTGLTVDPLALASVQWLHCMTFTATHLGAMYFIQRSVPRELSARAQGLYSALATGFNFGLSLPAAGFLYERIGGADTFLAMAVLSATGLGLTFLLARVWHGGEIFPERPATA